jgi:hypothetical protein
MAQTTISLDLRVPLRVKITMRLLTFWVWLGSFFPDGLVTIEIDAKALSDDMEYRAGKGAWRRLGD